MKVININWISESSGYPGIEREVGTEYYHSVRAYAENIRNYSGKVNNKAVCKENNFIHKLIFIIAGLTNEYEYGFCGAYYCNDKKIEEKINFSKQIYNLLTI